MNIFFSFLPPSCFLSPSNEASAHFRAIVCPTLFLQLICNSNFGKVQAYYPRSVRILRRQLATLLVCKVAQSVYALFTCLEWSNPWRLLQHRRERHCHAMTGRRMGCKMYFMMTSIINEFPADDVF
jgi:hypothetical protein